MRRIALILLCAALSLQAQSLSGRRAPSFSLPDSKLQQHDILDYRGKWLLLNFMKTDKTICPHCKGLSQTLESIKARNAAKVAVLCVVLPPDNTATVAQYIAENKVTVPILFDSSQMAIPYYKATPAHSYFDTPHLFAIDPSGMIVRDWGQDAVEAKSFAGELDQLINGKK